MSAPCPQCLRRSLTLELLSPFIENARGSRAGLRDVLALDDETLALAVGGARGGALAEQIRALDCEAARDRPGRVFTCSVCPRDEQWPGRLAGDPTIKALYVSHDSEHDPRRPWTLMAESTPSVAIVGTRRASPEGTRIARELARGLSAAGVTVVSGMALGIDSAAHEGALEGGGNTIAVLAGGSDEPYPRSKAGLHRRIFEVGAIVSELPPGAPPRKWGFLARNRIIAALAQATIVVEAAQKSGSLITAEFALELGRDVLAVPGSLRSWRSDGTNALIRDGATLVRDARDVLDALLGPEMAARAGAVAADSVVSAPRDLDPGAAHLLRLIERGATAGELLASAGAREAALAQLAELELLGLVTRTPEGGYARATV